MRRRAGGGGSAARGGGTAADRLSALPDALLHRVMSSLKAWEVVRTCVLARRWRDLWASAPCVDLRLRLGRDDGDSAPEDFARFVRRLFRHRKASAPVDTLRLRSSDVDGEFDEEDARSWIRAAIKRKARVIHLIGHRRGLAVLEHAAFVSHHLKILKLSYALLDGDILRQFSSRCPSLEEMDLKDCLVTGREISSASLKTLTMVNCTINVELYIDVPNLLLLHCVKPITRAPSFKNLGSLVAATIVLDDHCFSDDYEDFSEDELDETTDDDELDDTSDDEYSNDKHKPVGYKDDYDYGSDIDSDDNTCQYSEIAKDCDEHSDGHSSKKDGNRNVYGQNSGSNGGKIVGGHNVLHSLSNATSLELLADAGEVILTRELKRCPRFSNLKTLSLGEWCMDADFDALVFMMQHSPILERLFLELKLNFNIRSPLESHVKPNGRSFSCNHLQMVKIRCSKDDVRVHKLANLFRANGIPVEKIFVRRTGSTYLRGKKMMRDLARHEQEFWGE
ncbi:hypothetical protein ACP70R_003346 [Stipagrostis hirtigluma subsp. patula]